MDSVPTETKIVAFPLAGPANGSAASDPKHPAAGTAGAPPPAADEFAAGMMTVSQAAQQLCVCRVTIYNLMEANVLVGVHFGRSVDGRRRQLRVSRRSVERYLAQGLAHATTNNLNHETLTTHSPLRRAA